MFFSVVVPVYNRADEVDELLDSLTKQTFSNFEVIIVEDGSTVTCENVVDKYKGQLNYQDKKPITIENAMVVIFAHEAEHNLNKLDILSIRHSINNNCKNPRDVERSAKRITNKTLKEIYYAK